ncbi:MAG: hypothetical protein V4819_20725 [Verrucomicrobiota bacterium]
MKSSVVTLLICFALPSIGKSDEAKNVALTNDEVSAATIIRASRDSILIRFTNKNSYPVVVPIPEGVLERKRGDRWEDLRVPGWICGSELANIPSSVQVGTGKTVELEFRPGITHKLVDLKIGDEIRFSFIHVKPNGNAPGEHDRERIRIVTSQTFKIEQAGAGQPATASESKLEGGETPKPESEPSSR